MKEKTNKNNIIIFSLLILAILVITIASSFAYFTANISGSETSTTITTTGGTMNINYSGGPNINLADIYPRDEVWTTKTFTITGNSFKNMN